MKLKTTRHLLPNWILPAIGLTVLIGVCGVAWWKYTESQELKLQLERERVVNAFRQAGVAAAKIQNNSRKSVVEEDVLAPHELSDEAELAQAKLWQSMSNDQREKLRAEIISAGLKAGRSERPVP